MKTSTKPGLTLRRAAGKRAAGILVAGVLVGGVALQPTAFAETSSDPTSSASASGTGKVFVAPAYNTDTKGVKAKVYDVKAKVYDIRLPVSTLDGAATVVEDKDATTTTLASDVNFEVDSAQLTGRAHEILDGMIKEWKDAPPSRVEISGHTDSVADDAHNQTLSEQRAEAVKNYIDSKRPGLTITAEGKGESEPIAEETNEDGSVSEEGKAANRRVEIVAKQ